MLLRRVWAVFSILCECMEDRLRWQTIKLCQLLVHEMRIMDNGQKSSIIGQIKILEIEKLWGEIRRCSPAVILGREMAEEVTETSGSKICFSRPTCSPTQATGLEDRSSSLFVTSNYFPLENNILLCLAILSWVQRYCSKGGIFWVSQPWPQLHLPFVIKCMRHDKSTLEFCLTTPLLKGLTLHLPSPERGVTRVPIAFQFLSEMFSCAATFNIIFQMVSTRAVRSCIYAIVSFVVLWSLCEHLHNSVCLPNDKNLIKWYFMYCKITIAIILKTDSYKPSKYNINIIHGSYFHTNVFMFLNFDLPLASYAPRDIQLSIKCVLL